MLELCTGVAVGVEHADDLGDDAVGRFGVTGRGVPGGVRRAHAGVGVDGQDGRLDAESRVGVEVGHEVVEGAATLGAFGVP